jgi:mRNA-degrading endonuclease RelE of RelBE toxin-antitoxin system
MPYRVVFSPEAARQRRALRASDRAKIFDHAQRVLAVNPTLESRARVKRLVGVVSPAYRLRVDEYRVFPDIDEQTQVVTVYGAVAKESADEWLARFQQEE